MLAPLAVKVQNLPDWNVDWEDTKPQQPRSSLTCDDFLPSKDDADALNKSAIHFIMEFLVEEFHSLHHLKPHLSGHQSPHQVKCPKVAPMPILFRD